MAVVPGRGRPHPAELSRNLRALCLYLAGTLAELIVEASTIGAMQVQHLLPGLFIREALDVDFNRLPLVPRISKFSPNKEPRRRPSLKQCREFLSYVCLVSHGQQVYCFTGQEMRFQMRNEHSLCSSPPQDVLENRAALRMHVHFCHVLHKGCTVWVHLSLERIHCFCFNR